MRRRDATDRLLFPQRRAGWPALMCAGLSLGLHVLLLGAATFAVLAGTRPSELIRVSLLSGGGVDSGAPAAQSAAVVPIAPPAPPKPQRQTQRAPARFVAAPRRARVASRDLASVHPSEPAEVATQVGAAVGAGATSGSGGSGLGSGSGSGDGTDQRAACVYCPKPRYPFIARARGWQGSVDVGLLVLADGRVDTASLRRSSGYDVLDDAAIAVARQSRFSPPAAQGLPAPLHGRIEYRFELTNAR